MLFENNHHTDAVMRRRYAAYEIAYTLVDFLAALLFVAGSIMFFYDAWVYTGTWLFLIGSVFFACKPSIRIIRDIRLAAAGRSDLLAKQGRNE